MLNEKKREIGRRNFIKAVATVPAAGVLLLRSRNMWPVKTAIVGVGGQGGVLVENAPPTHMRIVAVCDIAPDNLARGLDVVRKRFDPEAQGYTDYNEMLKRTDIEAVLVATPLWLHEPVTVAALNAGKHVFCEKTMAHSIDQCRNMNAAARANRRQLQIGHQRVFNPLYHEANNLIQAGVIGDVYHVRAVWHRNTDWRRRVPELDFDPSPFGYPSLEHLKNWRLYRKYSQGLMAELGSHQIQIVNWFTGALPKTVYSSGGTYRFKDGREVADHVYCVFEYPEDLTLVYTTIQSNKFDDYYEEIMGTEGTIILRAEREALLFSEGGKDTMATKIEVEAAKGGGAPILSASESRLRDTSASYESAQASGYNPLLAYRDEMAGFCDMIRNGAPNRCDGALGMDACVPIVMANESMDKGEKLEIGPQLYHTT